MASTETKAAEPATSTDDQLMRVRARLDQLREQHRELGAQAAELRQQRDEAVAASADRPEAADDADAAAQQLGRIETRLQGIAGAIELADGERRELEARRRREQAGERYADARRALAKRDVRLNRAADYLAKAFAAADEAVELTQQAKRALFDAVADQRRNRQPMHAPALEVSTLDQVVEILVANAGWGRICDRPPSPQSRPADPVANLDGAAEKVLASATLYLPDDARPAIEREAEPAE